MSITIKNVTKNYGTQQALSDVSFELKKGEIVGFLGPNGAGKSTLMKIICCYLLQDRGNVEVCDLDTKEKDLIVKSKIGYLAENNPLYLEMYIQEYLSFVAGIYNVKRKKERISEIIYQNFLVETSNELTTPGNQTPDGTPLPSVLISSNIDQKRTNIFNILDKNTIIFIKNLDLLCSNINSNCLCIGIMYPQASRNCLSRRRRLYSLYD